MSSHLSLGLESEGWVLSKADSRLFQPGMTTFAHSVRAHTRLFMLPVDADTQDCIYSAYTCIHVRFVYVPSVWCVHMHPQNRAEGAKNPLAPLGPDPISESDVDQGSEGPHDPSPWP